MQVRDYALLAQEAYSAKPDIGVADSASRAIVRNTADGLCIAFPGTDNVASWLADLNTVPRSVPGMGNVHAGFYGAWEAIAPQVIAAIGDQPVTFASHSLGAAMSILAAATLTLAGKPPVAVYAFEPPRASFDLTLRILLAKVPLHLYRNGLDVVTNLPPGGMHPATLIHVGKPSVPVVNVQDHYLNRVLNSFPSDVPV
jgi:triacylglycerol lipase